MACVATWSFGLQAVQVAASELQAGASCMDALEKAINDVENDPSTGPYYVGRGCYPNSEGRVQLDAAVMRGSDCGFGAVAALEGYAKPISVARCVLEKASASMLVGKGAADFAKTMNFKMESNDTLLTERTKKAFEEHALSGAVPNTGHDTIGLLCLDKSGSLAAGVSTSGPPFKLPGRVGDSPLPGCGLYADDESFLVADNSLSEQVLELPAHEELLFVLASALALPALVWLCLAHRSLEKHPPLEEGRTSAGSSTNCRSCCSLIAAMQQIMKKLEDEEKENMEECVREGGQGRGRGDGGW